MTEEKLLALYDGVFEPWKMRLALSRIKAMRFPKRDWGDMMQEAAMVIWSFEFVPAKANGATELTVLYAVINQHLLDLMRKRCRYRKRYEKVLRQLGVHEDGTFHGEEPSSEMIMPVTMDVQTATEKLPDFEKDIAFLLSQGYNCNEIARMYECEWKTINRAMQRIKACFDAVDVNGELLK